MMFLSRHAPESAQSFGDWSVGRIVAMLLALLLWQAGTVSLVIAGEQVESSSDWFGDDAAPVAIECPFGIDSRPAAARVVLQIIDGTLHKWEEHDLFPGQVCLVQVRPEERMLSPAEALALRERSARWKETTPSYDHMEILSPDDPRLTVPPAIPPEPETPPSVESDRPDKSDEIDAEGPPGLPRSGDTRDEPGRHPPGEADAIQPEVVIGADQRRRVTSFASPTDYPWWVIGFHGHTFPDGSRWRCTGFVVGPRMAMTNAHCIYNSARGGHARSVSLAPAQTQASAGSLVVRPFGSESACEWRTNQQYIDTGGAQYDYAATFFASSWGSKGIDTYMPLVFEVTPSVINTAGYPGTALGSATRDMWYASDFTNVTVVGRILRYTADTSGGQSGSPVWELLPPPTDRRVVAVHAFGNEFSGYNGGPRLVSQNQPLIEQWMANQASYCGGAGASIALYDPGNSTFFLRNTNSSGPADTRFRFGPSGAGWVPISGDWDDDGQTTIGLYDPASSTFFLRNTNSGGAANARFRFGPSGAGWVPTGGDWDGDGQTTIGLYDPASSTFFLRNTNSGGAANARFRFGPSGAGWVPISGDWDGDGQTTIGLYDPASSTFFLRNTNSGGAANARFRFGPSGAGWVPVSGDWDDDGQTTIGLYDPASSSFFLRNTNSGGAADVTFRFGPSAAGWTPITGQWSP